MSELTLSFKVNGKLLAQTLEYGDKPLKEDIEYFILCARLSLLKEFDYE